MSRMYTHSLNQTCTYWAVAGLDDYGQPTFASPVSFDCRWEDVQKMFVNQHGDETTSSSVVFLGGDVENGGWLYLGTSVATTPPTGAMEIQGFSKIPNRRGTSFERKAYL